MPHPNPLHLPEHGRRNDILIDMYASRCTCHARALLPSVAIWFCNFNSDMTTSAMKAPSEIAQKDRRPLE